MQAKRESTSILNLAWQKRRDGLYDRAYDLVKEAEEMCGEEDYAALGRIHHLYRQFEADQGKLEEALVHSQQSVQYYEQAGTPEQLAHAIRHLGDLQRKQGLWVQAEYNLQRALSLYRSQSDIHPGDLANTLRAWALLLEQQQQQTEAITAWQEVRILYQACGTLPGVEEADQRLASLMANEST